MWEDVYHSLSVQLEFVFGTGLFVNPHHVVVLVTGRSIISQQYSALYDPPSPNCIPSIAHILPLLSHNPSPLKQTDLTRHSLLDSFLAFSMSRLSLYLCSPCNCPQNVPPTDSRRTNLDNELFFRLSTDPSIPTYLIT